MESECILASGRIFGRRYGRTLYGRGEDGYASRRVKTPAGNVHVSWKIEDGAFKIDYEVPQNMEVVR